jgi:hypothetical protein
MKKTILLFGVLLLMAFLSKELLADYSDNFDKCHSKTDRDICTFLPCLSLLNYDVTFHVTSNGNDLEGAWVTVGPVALPTDASGIAVFSLQDGNYSYTITKPGYADEEGSFAVAGAPMQIEVDMEPCWDIVLHLIDMNGLTITDSALVIVNNDTVWSTTGSPSFCVTDLTINYEVYIEGYYPNIGVMTIPPYPVILEIIMNPIFSEITFFVNCCGEPLGGIMLTIGTITVVTGPDGLVAFNLMEGDYSIEINGYIFTFSVPETTYIDADICSEVTFQVKDEQGNPLENVLIDVDGSYLLTDFNGEADTCLQVGSYTYEATKLGYVIQTGTFEVDTTSQTIEIVMQCESYPVSVFCSTFCLNDFEGLVFYINGEIVTNGGTIWLCNGDYSLSMGILDCPEWWPGYYGAFTVSGSAITISVELPSGITIPKVTFHVTSTQGGNIQGAEVVVEEDTLYTDSSGEATFCMTGGDHYYSVAKENYDTINGIFNFPCENITIEVLMDQVAINYINYSDFKLYPNPTEGKFYLEAINSGTDPIELQVMDLTGLIVYERKQAIPETIEIDLSNQQKGMYFLGIKTEEENYTQKLIIQ